MLTVTDQLGIDLLAFRGRADDAGFAVMDPGHGVVEMRQVRRPGFIDRPGFLVACVRVRHRYRAELRGFFGKVHCAGKLRRQVRDSDQAVRDLIQMPESLPVGIPQIGAVLGALFLLGEEGPLHVDAEQRRTALRLLVPQALCREIRGLQHLIGQRHRRRSEARHPVFSQIARHFLQPIVVSVREVRAGVAVGVDIDQARDHVLSLQVDAVLRSLSLSDLAEDAVLDGKPGPHEALVFQKYCCVLEPLHHVFSL